MKLAQAPQGLLAAGQARGGGLQPCLGKAEGLHGTRRGYHLQIGFKRPSLWRLLAAASWLCPLYGLCVCLPSHLASNTLGFRPPGMAAAAERRKREGRKQKEQRVLYPLEPSWCWAAALTLPSLCFLICETDILIIMMVNTHRGSALCQVLS